MLFRVLSTLAVGWCLASCSLLFSEASTDGAEPYDAGPTVEICEGEQRNYPRGGLVGDSTERFERFDHGQGTVTFWVKPLAPMTVGEIVPLVHLSGISITTNHTGSIFVRMPGLEAQEFDGVDAWGVGEELFVALRWDSRRPVSGDQGTDAHLMLHLGTTRDFAVFSEFTPKPDAGAAGSLLVGDGMGFFNVDQLVVYNRPLFVDDEAANDNELAQLAETKRASAVLVRGGLEVSFATTHRQTGECNTPGSEGWAMPLARSEVPGDIREGDFAGWLDANDEAVTPESIPGGEERVYGAGLALEPGARVYAPIQLSAEESYVIFALAHGDPAPGGNSFPGVTVYAMDGESRVPAPVIAMTSNDGTPERPKFLFGTFEMPDGLANIELELDNISANVTAEAVFHTVHIFENRIANPSFESPICNDIVDFTCEVSAGWIPEVEGEARAYVVNSDREPGGDLLGETSTGVQAVCFNGSGESSEIETTIAGGLEAGAIYVMGVAVYWPEEDPMSEPPRIAGEGSSDLLGTGGPAVLDVAASAFAAVHDRWHVTGTAAYENNGNQQIEIGPLIQGAADFANSCIDDAYLFEVMKIRGASF